MKFIFHLVTLFKLICYTLAHKVRAFLHILHASMYEVHAYLPCMNSNICCAKLTKK